jgi:hypothetical protein
MQGRTYDPRNPATQKAKTGSEKPNWTYIRVDCRPMEIQIQSHHQRVVLDKPRRVTTPNLSGSLGTMKER